MASGLVRIHAKGLHPTTRRADGRQVESLASQTLRRHFKQFACMGQQREFDMLGWCIRNQSRTCTTISGSRALGLILRGMIRKSIPAPPRAGGSVLPDPQRTAARGSCASVCFSPRTRLQQSATKPSSKSSTNSIGASHLIGSVEGARAGRRLESDRSQAREVVDRDMTPHSGTVRAASALLTEKTWERNYELDVFD